MILKKRASLEISIQAIVIIVLAMTLLGLGLGFIRNMFEGISKTTNTVTEQVAQNLRDQLLNGDRKLAFTTTEIATDVGGSEKIYIGIRNKNPDTLRYRVDFIARSGPAPGGSGVIQEFGSPTAMDNWFQYGKQDEYTLSAGLEIHTMLVRIRVPQTIVGVSTQPGAYLVTFRITDLDTGSVYDEKDFFINVRG